MSGIANLAELKQALLTETPEKIKQATQKGMSDAMILGMKNIKQDLDEREIWETRALINSVLIDVSKLRNMQGSIYTYMEYAPHVEFGHRIVRNGQQVGYRKGEKFMAKEREKLPNTLVDRILLRLGEDL